jgi:hypothetical protein
VLRYTSQPIRSALLSAPRPAPTCPQGSRHVFGRKQSTLPTAYVAPPNRWDTADRSSTMANGLSSRMALSWWARGALVDIVHLGACDHSREGQRTRLTRLPSRKNRAIDCRSGINGRPAPFSRQK